jgi:uncharacterized membrane protein
MRKTLGVWKTTVLGGAFFLVPFAVVVFLIGQVAYVISLVATPMAPYLNKWSIGGASLAIILATLLVVALCYLAGLAARRSLGARFSEKIERYLLILFPRYGVLKDQIASNFGSQTTSPSMKSVLVTFDDAARLGFEVERTPAGAVTVYLPGAPDPWQGHVVHVPAERVSPLAVEFGEAVAICETLGRQTGRVVENIAPPLSSPTPTAV